MAAAASESPWLSSLGNSLALVPPAAVPAFVDCFLVSSAFSASELFSTLLGAFARLAKGVREGGCSNFDTSSSRPLISYAAALFHLLKKPDVSGEAFELFIRRDFLPLLCFTAEDDKELLDQLEDWLCDVVAVKQCWDLVASTVIPLSLRSICLWLDIRCPKELSIYQWDNTESIESSSMSLAVASRVLSSLISVSRREEMEVVDGVKSSETFARNITWDLSLTSVDILVQPSERRSEAIRLVFPVIFRTVHLHPLFDVFINGKVHTFSRDLFYRKLWQKCITMLGIGNQERRDAYSLISMHLSLLSAKFHANNSMNLEDDKLWEGIRQGLVDRDASVRKHSLYILKKLLRPENASPALESSVPVAKNFVVSSCEDIVQHSGISRRERWADKEAKSMGVGEVCSYDVNSLDKWNAFFLLYEMLEEYGTHLVEAAWAHQMSLLFQSGPCEGITCVSAERSCDYQMQTLDNIFNWLAILWERGFFHENPQVRCLIMQSFLSMDWKSQRRGAKYVPKNFVLGPFILGINDPIHHKDFGLGGHYTSITMQGAKDFIHEYAVDLSRSKRMDFVLSLSNLVRKESFGRAGLMVLVSCLSSAAILLTGAQKASGILEQENWTRMEEKLDDRGVRNCRSSELLDTLGIIIERSKQHFNPNYRLQVCERVMEATSAMLCAKDAPLEMVLHFISLLPREFTDFGGTLRSRVRRWLCFDSGLLRQLVVFPAIFIKRGVEVKGFDDEDLDAWITEAQRWVRLLFLMATGDQDLELVLQVIQDAGGANFYSETQSDLLHPRFLVLVICLVDEVHIQLKKWECYYKPSANIFQKKKKKPIANDEYRATDVHDELLSVEPIFSFSRLRSMFLLILDNLMPFSSAACSVFWSGPIRDDINLPSAVKGKLGGPSPRRLPLHLTAAVLHAILSVKTVASILSFIMKLGKDLSLNSSFSTMWNICCKVILFQADNSETGSEIKLAAFETLGTVLKALAPIIPASFHEHIVCSNKCIFGTEQIEFLLDPFLLNFLSSINSLLDNGTLTRSRRAVLMKWKWICLDSLLSIPCTAYSLFSDSTLTKTFSEVVESLMNAGEASVLPLLRCARSIIGILHRKTCSELTPWMGFNAEMMMDLVQSSWMLHLSCNKRRVAPIAALLSSVLHPFLFNDLSMHEMNGEKPGPLKWFVEKILEEGTKSPRTLRLAALHLTGLWLAYPRTIKYYMKELTLLSLHGSVAFDEDFASELVENQEAVFEVSMLAKIPQSELAEVFINTEMYARASVAVLFEKLGNLAKKCGNQEENDVAQSALQSGKMFLLDLLHSAVNDKDLSKELYKKYSAVHRRKVRAWQMLCVLSCFIDQDIVNEVSLKMHACLFKNNLPSVRQYLEIFAIQVYLKFPSLVEELLPIFHDYDVRPQALSSYVYVASNIIQHTSEVAFQLKHLNALLPPIIPFLTSHHHSLRGFSQLLVYHVLCKVMPVIENDTSNHTTIEKKCFEELKFYLTGNVDCVRLRASMGGLLDSFDPRNASTVMGVFNARNEGSCFECVPVTLMEQLTEFLNDVREDLRHSMAKEAMTIKNEHLDVPAKEGTADEMAFSHMPLNLQKHFQKKISLDGLHNMAWGSEGRGFSVAEDTPRLLSEIEKEDRLYSLELQSMNHEIRQQRGSQQSIILVASLIDRIPNLGGLARTCEVFSAAGLAIADVSVIRDKQFQLISVTADKWVPIIEVPVCNLKTFLKKKKHEGFSILGLEQTTNSTAIDRFPFPKKTVLVLGHEKEGIPVDIIHGMDGCVEIPQLGVVRSLNVHVSGAIALWEYTRQHRSSPP